MILSSCSSDDSTDSANIQINPPTWIQGKWILNSSSSVESGWRFTSNDFIIIQGNTEVSQRAQLEAFSESGQSVSATDTFTDNTYEVTLNNIGGQTSIFSFTRLSADVITYDSIQSSEYIRQ